VNCFPELRDQCLQKETEAMTEAMTEEMTQENATATVPTSEILVGSFSEKAFEKDPKEETGENPSPETDQRMTEAGTV
jgi:hypothetical protein